MQNHESRAIERERKLANTFDRFCKSWTEAQRSQVFLNRTLLLTAAEKYFASINQKKKEHGFEWADCHKRAAFTVKWLLWFRPIQFVSNHPPKELVLANEQFAFFVACGFLEIELGVIPRSLSDHCLHHFRNHSYDPESWACTFYLMEACGKADLFPAISEFFADKSPSTE